jgi:hypothetical protein
VTATSLKPAIKPPGSESAIAPIATTERGERNWPRLRLPFQIKE